MYQVDKRNVEVQDIFNTSNDSQRGKTHTNKRWCFTKLIQILGIIGLIICALFYGIVSKKIITNNLHILNPQLRHLLPPIAYTIISSLLILQLIYVIIKVGCSRGFVFRRYDNKVTCIVTAIFAVSYLAHALEYWYFFEYGYDAVPAEIIAFLNGADPIEFSEVWTHHMRHEMYKIVLSFWWDALPYGFMF